MKTTAKTKFSSQKFFSSEDSSGQEECSFSNMADFFAECPKMNKKVGLFLKEFF